MKNKIMNKNFLFRQQKLKNKKTNYLTNKTGTSQVLSNLSETEPI